MRDDLAQQLATEEGQVRSSKEVGQLVDWTQLKCNKYFIITVQLLWLCQPALEKNKMSKLVSQNFYSVFMKTDFIFLATTRRGEYRKEKMEFSMKYKDWEC